MEIIIYTLVFFIGLLMGSFFSLAIYRIPLGENIVNKRSFCPSCNHRLEFLDLIPVLSYVFLKGKCRYCSQKIGKRYIMLELFSGIIFLSFALSLNLNFYYIEISKLTYLLFGFLYLIAVMLIAGIDKEKGLISKKVLLYGVVVAFIYILYLYVVEKANIYRYVIYLFFMAVFLGINIYLLKKKGKENYTLDVLNLSMLILTFSGGFVFELSVILTLVFTLFATIFFEVKNKRNEGILPIGYYLCISNIIILIIHNFIIMGG